MSGYISTHTGNKDTALISAKRFEQSPYLACYENPEMVRGFGRVSADELLGFFPEPENKDPYPHTIAKSQLSCEETVNYLTPRFCAKEGIIKT